MKLSYWKRYDRVFKVFSPEKIYNKILGFARNLGKPFKKKSKRVNELSYGAHDSLIFQGKSEQILEDVYKKLEAPQAPSRVITPVNNGLIKVDRALFGK